MLLCYACKSTDCTAYLKVKDYTLYHCNSCDLLFTSLENVKRTTFVNHIYTKTYVNNYRKLLPRFYKRFQMLKSLIESVIPGGKLLDVGCGTGYFLKYLQESSSAWDAVGVEPNVTLRQLASNDNIVKVVKGNLTSIPFEDSSFDVVTCLDVLEHSVSLNKNVKELYRVIRKDGILVIQAPNYQSFMAKLTGSKWDWWSPPDHVLHFTPGFIAKYLSDNNFKVIKSFTYEDQLDYLMNIKGNFRRNFLTKAMYVFALPLLLAVERIGWLINKGGLLVIVAQRK